MVPTVMPRRRGLVGDRAVPQERHMIIGPGSRLRVMRHQDRGGTALASSSLPSSVIRKHFRGPASSPSPDATSPSRSRRCTVV
jgi:hypothetical protein